MVTENIEVFTQSSIRLKGREGMFMRILSECVRSRKMQITF